MWRLESSGGRLPSAGCSLRLSLLTTRRVHPQFPAPRQDGRKQRPPENNVLAIKPRRGDRGYVKPTLETSCGHVQVSGEPTGLLLAASVETLSRF